MGPIRLAHGEREEAAVGAHKEAHRTGVIGHRLRVDLPDKTTAAVITVRCYAGEGYVDSLGSEGQRAQRDTLRGRAEAAANDHCRRVEARQWSEAVAWHLANLREALEAGGIRCAGTSWEGPNLVAQQELTTVLEAW